MSSRLSQVKVIELSKLNQLKNKQTNKQTKQNSIRLSSQLYFHQSKLKFILNQQQAKQQLEPSSDKDEFDFLIKEIKEKEAKYTGIELFGVAKLGSVLKNEFD